MLSTKTQLTDTSQAQAEPEQPADEPLATLSVSSLVPAAQSPEAAQEAKPETQAEVQAQPESQPELQPEAEREAETQPEGPSVAEPQPQSEHETKPDPLPDSSQVDEAAVKDEAATPVPEGGALPEKLADSKADAADTHHVTVKVLVCVLSPHAGTVFYRGVP